MRKFDVGIRRDDHAKAHRYRRQEDGGAVELRSMQLRNNASLLNLTSSLLCQMQFYGSAHQFESQASRSRSGT